MSSAVLGACERLLADFGTDETGYPRNLPGVDVHKNLSASGRGFAPYTLTGPQVGAVSLLLYEAKRLAKKNKRLKKALKQTQGFVDTSIRYLDPKS
jgi:hypothetical protein